MPDHPRLFDPGPALPEHPGDMSYEDWLNRSDVAFHGTVVHEDHDPHLYDPSHYGPRDLAANVAYKAASQRYYREPPEHYISEDDYGGENREITDPTSGERFYVAQEGADRDDYEGLAPGEARVYARRLHNISPHQFSDREVNGAHVIHAVSQGDDSVREGVAQTAGNPPLSAIQALRAGQALQYTNVAERGADNKTGHPSWLVPDPSRTTSSWEEDVAAAPRRSPAVREYMADRISRGVPQRTAPLLEARYLGKQFSLFGGEENLYDEVEVPSMRPDYLDEEEKLYRGYES